MTEQLQVDTDRLKSAGAGLKLAAGQIPTQLPQFPVNGTDRLSAAIAEGAVQVEAWIATAHRRAHAGARLTRQRS